MTTPLGIDELLFSNMRGKEELGRMFEFEVVMYSANPEINIDDILAQNVTIELELEDGHTRYFNGFITKFSQTDTVQGGEGYSVYEATISPWLWFLTRTSDCRIFQEMTVPDIVKKVFNDNGFSDFVDKLSGTYRQYEYCVQYRETDFNFISRLLEQEGIYYYFTHEEGRHQLVLSDAYSSHAPINGDYELPYHPPGTSQTVSMEHVSGWNIDRGIQPGKYALTDYDFKKPKNNLLVQRIVKRNHSESEREMFDYPGEYVDASDGEQYALERIEELQAGFEKVSGVTDARNMACGTLFKLSNHPRSDQNREYLVTRTNYDLVSNEYSSVGASGQEVYTCQFEAVESKTVFRADRSTPKPVVQGPQTAVVVGPAGEEIYPDEFGRVKVQFHWDRYGKKDENSSCWIRVAQAWAGPGWGAQFIPRIGQEVMIEFLEGDPDRPIITGRVYNADNMPPYSLPDSKTQSGFKSRSTKGASAANFNELRMEDKKGNEEFYVQAEKNYNQLVKNDRAETIGHDRSLDVGHDKSETVANNKSIVIGVDHTEAIGSNKALSVGANHTETIASNMTISVGSNLTETVAVNYAETVGVAMELTVGTMMAETIGASKTQTIGLNNTQNIGSNKDQTIGKNKSVKVGVNADTNIGKNLSEDIGDSRTVSVGKDDSIKVGKKFVLDVGDEITIRTGKASINMKKDGTITIQGKDITLKGSGGVNVKASDNVVMKGKKILQN
jgi:type VI secretion system secreted protein VgrG